MSDSRSGTRAALSRTQVTGDDEGAALVETAFIIILLMMLLVGIISAAVALGRDNSIQNAAREASRFGATLPDVDTQLSVVADVAEAAALGDLDSGVQGRYICVSYLSSSGNTRHVVGTPPTLPGDDTCYVDGRPAGEERVQVVVGRDTSFNVIVWSTDITLEAQAGARYER